MTKHAVPRTIGGAVVIKAPVLGRKNYGGSKSERGTEVSAAMYSLVETAKHEGLNPQR